MKQKKHLRISWIAWNINTKNIYTKNILANIVVHLFASIYKTKYVQVAMSQVTRLGNRDGTLTDWCSETRGTASAPTPLFWSELHMKTHVPPVLSPSVSGRLGHTFEEVATDRHMLEPCIRLSGGSHSHSHSSTASCNTEPSSSWALTALDI